MRLIDADELWGKCKTLEIKTPIDRLFALRKIATWIKDAPAVDTERHGRWENIRNFVDGHKMAQCSVCPAFTLYCGDEYTYCPHCGARMDEVSE